MYISGNTSGNKLGYGSENDSENGLENGLENGPGRNGPGTPGISVFGSDLLVITPLIPFVVVVCEGCIGSR